MDNAGFGFALLVVVYANTCISERCLDCGAKERNRIKIPKQIKRLKKGIESVNLENKK